MTTSLLRITRFAAIPMLALVWLSFASPTHAATFTANETTENATLGADTQTAVATTTTANVAEVKATRTLTVGSAPTNTQTFTIGTCVVTFATTTAGVGTEDVTCSGGATILTTTGTSGDIPRTTTQIATALQGLTGVTDTGHGGLTVTSSTTSATSVVFTTTGTEATTTPITYSAGTASGITSTNSVSGTVPVAQVTRITPANVEEGDIFTAVVNGTTVNYTAGADTVADVTAGLAAAINASAAAASTTAADVSSTYLTVTADTAGTSFTLTATTTNRVAAAQVVTFTPADVEAVDFTVTINNTDYSVHGSETSTVQSVVEDMAAALATAPGVTCTEDNTKVTCTANVAGTGFTYAAAINDLDLGSGGGNTSSHRRGSGGGGSSRTITNHGLTDVVPTTPAATQASPNAVFMRDLTMGATGADVTALQTWLIAQGYSIPAGATGYFGVQTTAALAAFQKASGIVPSVGYFGPITRAYIASHF